MRLVPVMNSQKSSGPRLYYKAFVGTKPARSNGRINTMSDALPSETTEREWAAFAAIDWADQKHFWRLVPADSPHAEQGELENTPEAVEVWAAALERRFGGRPIAICLELSRGPLAVSYTHLRAHETDSYLVC